MDIYLNGCIVAFIMGIFLFGGAPKYRLSGWNKFVGILMMSVLSWIGVFMLIGGIYNKKFR